MHLNFRRILVPTSMCFELDTQPEPDADERPEDFDPEDERNINRIREELIGECADLLDASGQAVNRNRLFRDLYNREKRAGTAVGEGVAVPHVRTLQAKSFVMAFGRSTEGLHFRAPDGNPVHLFFAMVSPPYEDRAYLKVYRTIGRVILEGRHFDSLMEASEPNEIWNILDRFK